MPLPRPPTRPLLPPPQAPVAAQISHVGSLRGPGGTPAAQAQQRSGKPLKTLRQRLKRNKNFESKILRTHGHAARVTSPPPCVAIIARKGLCVEQSKILMFVRPSDRPTDRPCVRPSVRHAHRIGTGFSGQNLGIRNTAAIE